MCWLWAAPATTKAKRTSSPASRIDPASVASQDFIQAKYDFVDDMLAFSGAKAPKRILDVGCGIGGTSRHLAAKFPEAEVVGITLSPQQVERAARLAKERGLEVSS